MSAEASATQGSAPASTQSSTQPKLSLYGGTGTGRRVTVRDLAKAKREGEKWAMLTAYDALTAGVFDEAGIPVLLVGDSAGNNHLGYENTVPVTVDQLVMLAGAVVRGTKHAMVIGDLPFGSYQSSPSQALDTAARFMKEAGCGAVKLEGGRRVLPQVEALVQAGVPVMAHIGLTPQSVNVLGGYRIAGRGDEEAEKLISDAKALQHAGAFAIVLELVPAELAARVSAEIDIPTVGIGAGPDTDAQVLVWTDMAGLTPGGVPKFVKQYADMRALLKEAAQAFAADVVHGAYPDESHSYH
jgi:3-methyl-2-oxobutanoate hydroxymethyltransferase